MRTTSIMTTSWTTKADAGDAEGRVTAAHKTLILRQHHKKKQTKSPKSWKPVGWCWITSTSSSWRTTAALWGLEWVNTNPLILSKMFGISWYTHHKINHHKQFISGEFMWEGGDTAVRKGWSWWTWPTSAAELAPHIPTGSCNRKTWCLSDYRPEWPRTIGGKEPEVCQAWC